MFFQHVLPYFMEKQGPKCHDNCRVSYLYSERPMKGNNFYCKLTVLPSACSICHTFPNKKKKPSFLCYLIAKLYVCSLAV